MPVLPEVGFHQVLELLAPLLGVAYEIRSHPRP